LVSTFPDTMSGYFSEVVSTIGAKIRQGAHIGVILPVSMEFYVRFGLANDQPCHSIEEYFGEPM
jgi:hypothetical protein